MTHNNERIVRVEDNIDISEYKDVDFNIHFTNIVMSDTENNRILLKLKGDGKIFRKGNSLFIDSIFKFSPNRVQEIMNYKTGSGIKAQIDGKIVGKSRLNGNEVEFPYDLEKNISEQEWDKFYHDSQEINLWIWQQSELRGRDIQTKVGVLDMISLNDEVIDRGKKGFCEAFDLENDMLMQDQVATRVNWKSYIEKGVQGHRSGLVAHV